MTRTTGPKQQEVLVVCVSWWKVSSGDIYENAPDDDHFDDGRPALETP